MTVAERAELALPPKSLRELAVAEVAHGAPYVEAANRAGVPYERLCLAVRLYRTRDPEAGETGWTSWGELLERAASEYMRNLQAQVGKGRSPRYMIQFAATRAEIWENRYGIPEVREDYSEPWERSHVKVDEEYDADARRRAVESELDID